MTFDRSTLSHIEHRGRRECDPATVCHPNGTAMQVTDPELQIAMTREVLAVYQERKKK